MFVMEIVVFLWQSHRNLKGYIFLWRKTKNGYNGQLNFKVWHRQVYFMAKINMTLKDMSVLEKYRQK